MMVRLHLSASIFVLFSTVKAYTWPSPQYDALEELLYEGTNKGGTHISDIAAKCIPRHGHELGGPPVAAEWLRAAYHDMATHNITDGTGGLDASLYYELLREENVGAGMLTTFLELTLSPNKYVSRACACLSSPQCIVPRFFAPGADVLAMAAVWSVAACSGPPIPYRGGRIDATGAGREGVPQPHQDLQTHIDSFKLQGFNMTEMISLVACGHTLGGVRAADFPGIVQDKKSLNMTIGFFDSTTLYDNAIITEYLQSKTINPLVVNTNATTLSDLRIFSSDGNATIKSMESPAAFSTICQNLLERMLNTVPVGVILTEEIVLLPFKVKTAEFIVKGSDIVFNVVARIALPGTFELNSASPIVQMFWCNRGGVNADCADGTVNFANVSSKLSPGATSPSADILNISFQSYIFHVLVIPSLSIGKFWFGVREEWKPVEDTILQANGGQGYLVAQDVVVSVPELNLVERSQMMNLFRMVIGIKSNSAPALVEMHVYDRTIIFYPGSSFTSISPPRNFTVNLQPLPSRAPAGGYVFYTGNFTDANDRPSVDFVVVLDGRRYELDFVQTPRVSLPDDGGIGKLSAVGKINLTNATFGGQVNTKVGN